MILIELIFDAAPNAREDVADLARRTMAETQREKGCILYRFTFDLDLPHRFTLIELWESEEDLKAHFAGKAFKTFWAELPSGWSSVSSRAWQGPLVASVLPGSGQTP
ncbi:antibiotic biosynthesis monooxygenase [Ktedonosporobacter rubrisoli]|uniref:Antibiotic biosynthesis monooxygenase n=1 Tax=Ktedonosporobacter rubrisoli TaxID=2509675 RepID=A0A4V0YYD6_KTERU|nr:putative quinol monooxygenase [Ktedonosporobacter rubrisoli]QBD75851.1 antibiotic biosynthesis monooxygenase [Ktedonosporobacter rubrisoli]